MFAKLLATAMTSALAHKAHPAFAEIIKQLTPDEARILSGLAKNVGGIPEPIITMRVVVRHDGEPAGAATGLDLYPHRTTITNTVNLETPSLATAYVNNLCRLGLLAIDYTVKLAPHAYAGLESEPRVAEHLAHSSARGVSFETVRGQITVTAFGEMFIDACVAKHN